VLDALDASQLAACDPVDVASFWQGYLAANVADRRQFWLMLISAVARMESNFDPDCVYEEPPPLNQKSIGLMQLSLTDTAYGCEFPDEESIKDPKRNLSCAVRILERLVVRDGRIGGDSANRTNGGAAYWSTLRTANRGSKRDPRAYVISRTSVL
jgi:Transglycosylase SLT domain